MDEFTRNTLIRHLDSIKDADTDWSYFLGIADLVAFVKNTPQLNSKLEKAETGLFEGDWISAIRWNEPDVSEREIWKKMVFVYRIIYEGPTWHEALKDADPRSMESQYLASALSEIKHLSSNEPKMYWFFFQKKNYDAEVEHFSKFLLQEAAALTKSAISNTPQLVVSDVRAILLKELKPDDSQIYFVVNGDFAHQNRTKNKGHWNNLYKLASQKRLDFDSPEAAKQFKDYFNSEKDNVLWSKSIYVRRAILVTENSKTIRLAQGLTVEICPKRTWARYCNGTPV